MTELQYKQCDKCKHVFVSSEEKIHEITGRIENRWTGQVEHFDKSLVTLCQTCFDSIYVIHNVALRDNAGKPKIDYVLYLPRSLELLARIFEHGAAKYEDLNWRKGGKPDSEYLGSAMRHILAWVAGNVYDPTTGCNHLGHAIWNLMVLIDVNHPTKVVDLDTFNKYVEEFKLKKVKKDVSGK